MAEQAPPPQQQPPQPQQEDPQAIFRDIYYNDLAAVKARVQAAGGAALLDVRNHAGQTPLVYALDVCPNHTIPLWLVAHKGEHDLNTPDNQGSGALHYACNNGGLPLVKALIAGGADPARPGGTGRSPPLIIASSNEHVDIVEYLLELPAARATLDVVDLVNETALSTAVFSGSTTVVPILLEAGADPTLPPGRNSPLQLAARYSRLDTAAALCRILGAAIEEPNRARLLHRARLVRDLPARLAKARADARDKGRATEGEQRAAAVAAAPECLRGRVGADAALPRAALVPPGRVPGVGEEALATAAFVLDVEEEQEHGKGLPPELFVELLGYMLPVWADKGPDTLVRQPQERPPQPPAYHQFVPVPGVPPPQQQQQQAQQQLQAQWAQQQAFFQAQQQEQQQLQQLLAMQAQGLVAAEEEEEEMLMGGAGNWM